MLQKLYFPETLIQGKNFSEGLWAFPSGTKFKVRSPYNNKEIGEIVYTTSSDLDRMVKSADSAQKKWEDLGVKERTQVMFRFRQILLNKIDSISHLVALESGKTLEEARAGVLKGIEVTEFATSICNLDRGGRLEVSRGVHCEYRRVALGVVASITPFNFPAMVPLWTIPIALTLGNSFIWKPSEKTPLTANLIGESLQEAGVPPGVFNIAHGAKETVEGILSHPLIKAVSFVGSTQVAKIVYEKGHHAGKRVLALGGAKNHIILLPDAEEDLCGRGISDSFTGCAGQRCMAASVLLAVGNEKEINPLIKKIIERSSSLQLGHDMGALISKEQVLFLHQAIERAEKEGAQILLDGRKALSPVGFENGYWLGPTILDYVDARSEAAFRELFGPILSIVRCPDLPSALAIQNANPYGNACSVFTSKGSVAEYVAKKASAAMVGINVGVPVPREPFSFGGMNDSKFGHGDITGESSLNFWSHLKKVTTKWESSFQNWMS